MIQSTYRGADSSSASPTASLRFTGLPLTPLEGALSPIPLAPGAMPDSSSSGFLASLSLSTCVRSEFPSSSCAFSFSATGPLFCPGLLSEYTLKKNVQIQAIPASGVTTIHITRRESAYCLMTSARTSSGRMSRRAEIGNESAACEEPVMPPSSKPATFGKRLRSSEAKMVLPEIQSQQSVHFRSGASLPIAMPQAPLKVRTYIPNSACVAANGVQHSQARKRRQLLQWKRAA